MQAVKSHENCRTHSIVDLALENDFQVYYSAINYQRVNLML